MATNNPTQAPVAPAAPVLIPDAFKNHANLKPMALQMAVTLGEKHPDIVAAVGEFKAAFNVAGDKYITVVSRIRQKKMLRKEATLLLLGLGVHKGRASELITLSAVGDDVWAKYTAQTIGFRAALQLGTGKSSPGGTPAKPVKPATPPLKIHDVQAEVKKALATVCATFKRPLKNGEKTEWAYAHTHDGVNYYFAITTSPKS